MALVESDAPAPASMLATLVRTCRLFRDVMTRKQLWRKAWLQSQRREDQEPCVLFRSSWLGTYVSMLSSRMNAASIIYSEALRCWRRSGKSGKSGKSGASGASGVNSILRRMRDCGARWLREIDSVRMEEVDVGDFKRVYDRGRRPAMLRGCQRAMLGGRGESELTLAGLLEIYGNKKSGDAVLLLVVLFFLLLFPCCLLPPPPNPLPPAPSCSCSSTPHPSLLSSLRLELAPSPPPRSYLASSHGLACSCSCPWGSRPSVHDQDESGELLRIHEELPWGGRARGGGQRGPRRR